MNQDSLGIGWIRSELVGFAWNWSDSLGIGPIRSKWSDSLGMVGFAPGRGPFQLPEIFEHVDGSDGIILCGPEEKFWNFFFWK